MKACVKATGEIVEVNQCAIIHDDGTREIMRGTELDEVQGAPDYWTRLEHQYAGMAMQGILSDYELYREIAKSRNLESAIMEYASDLVKRLKEKEERKWFWL